MPDIKAQPDNRLAIFLVLVWLAVVITGFWWFQFKDIRAFANEASVVFFQGDQFSNQLTDLVNNIDNKSSAVTVVHFWDPDCSCNKFNEPHVKELIETYGQQDIRFVIVARVTDDALKNQVLAKARATFNYSAVSRVVTEQDIELKAMPSSPAVAVMNNQQSLVYFGPYSAGAVCNIENGAYVEKTLERLAKGKAKRQLNVLATGCFCTWHDSNKPV